MKLNAKIISVIIIGVIVLGLVLTKLDIITAKQNVPAQAVATGGTPVPFVKAAVLQPMTIEDKIVAKGSVIPNEEILVTSEISGKITKIHFQEGQVVQQGAMLVSIDDTELKAELAQQQIELEYLKKKEDRESKLLEKGGVSEQQYETTVRDRQATEADIALIKTRLEKTMVRAPFSGVVGLRYVSEGSYVSPSARITNLVDTSPVKLDFTVPEKYMSVVKTGTKIRFTIEGNSEEFEGSVYAIEPKIDQATRTISLRAISPNQGAKILPGAFTNIRIILNRIENAICIPSEAVIPELNAQKVFVMKKGLAQSVEVKLGLRMPELVQVVEGLSAGDTIITAGILQIRNGSKVEITDFKTIEIL